MTDEIREPQREQPTQPEPSERGDAKLREQKLREELKRRDAEAAKRGGSGDPLRGSRTSGFYAGVAALGIVLILLIIFIAQNTRKTTVKFLAWDGQVSVAVALLIAAAAGLFVALLASGLRILQLRRRVRRTGP